jgi:hypothetical protein
MSSVPFLRRLHLDLLGCFEAFYSNPSAAFQSTGTREPPEDRQWRGGRWIDIFRAVVMSMASAGTK